MKAEKRPRSSCHPERMIDDGHAVHFSELKRGTPVYGSDQLVVGTVVEALDNPRENIFDGLVIETEGGGRRFVDAPEVARTAERAVTLTITSAEVAQLGPPPKSGSLLPRFLRRR
jgi:hypothetical protein